LARRIDNGITLLDWRDVSRSEVTDHPKWQVDLIKAANEVPFLITASELRERKKKRRQKHSANGSSLNPPFGQMMILSFAGLGFMAYRRKSKSALMAA
jgi:hypothetical protein